MCSRARSCRRRSSRRTAPRSRIQVVEGYVDRVEWPASLSKYRDFFSYYTAKIIADRPTNVRTIERYLLLAGDLPGLKFKNSLKPSATNKAPRRWWSRWWRSRSTRSPASTIAAPAARGPYQFYTSATVNNLLRMHEAFTVELCGHVPD